MKLRVCCLVVFRSKWWTHVLFSFARGQIPHPFHQLKIKISYTWFIASTRYVTLRVACVCFVDDGLIQKLMSNYDERPFIFYQLEYYGHQLADTSQIEFVLCSAMFEPQFIGTCYIFQWKRLKFREEIRAGIILVRYRAITLSSGNTDGFMLCVRIVSIFQNLFFSFHINQTELLFIIPPFYMYTL